MYICTQSCNKYIISYRAIYQAIYWPISGEISAVFCCKWYGEQFPHIVSTAGKKGDIGRYLSRLGRYLKQGLAYCLLTDICMLHMIASFCFPKALAFDLRLFIQALLSGQALIMVCCYSGQIELFSHVPVLRNFVEHLQRKNFKVCCVYLLDSQVCQGICSVVGSMAGCFDLFFFFWQPWYIILETLQLFFFSSLLM